MKQLLRVEEGRRTPLSSTCRDQRGVTGLETAIILIAFVVVASVFAFTVLSTGIFSSERGKETVFAGLQEARGSIEPKGGIIANGLVADNLDLANADWTNAANVTTTLETTNKKEGTGSAKLEVATAFGTGKIAYKNLASTVDLTNQTQIRFWIRSSTSTTKGQLEIVLDESPNCDSPEAHIDVPILVVNTWKLVTAGITQTDGTTAVTNANKDAITCVGVEVEGTTLSASQNETVYVDQIVGAGLVTSIVINFTNAVEGEPVDMTQPSDSDDNGIADSDGTHVMVITYTDKNQLVRDLYWERTFLGNNDADDLLETGEKAKITVFLKGLADATPLVRDQEFTVEVKPPIGGVLNLQRTTPSRIDKVMNLN